MAAPKGIDIGATPRSSVSGMASIRETGFLLIADLTGYTAYLAGSETEHVPAIAGTSSRRSSGPNVPALVGSRLRHQIEPEPAGRRKTRHVEPVPGSHHLIQVHAQRGAGDPGDVLVQPLGHRHLVECAPLVGRGPPRDGCVGGLFSLREHAEPLGLDLESIDNRLLFVPPVGEGPEVPVHEGEPRESWEPALPEIVQRQVQFLSQCSDVNVSGIDELSAVLGGLAVREPSCGPAPTADPVSSPVELHWDAHL